MLIIAHRGARRDAPENTLDAFALALEQGADGIEFDVQVTADGVPVISHDDHVGATCGIDARISGASLAEVSTWNAGAARGGQAAIPTLAEVVARFGGRTLLYVELKASWGGPDGFRPSSLAAEAALPLLAGADGVVVSSFDPSGPALARAAGFPIAHGVAAAASCTPFVTTAAAAGCVQIHPEASMVDAQLVGVAHASGLAVIPWTVNDPALASTFRDLGVDGVFTDVPGGLSGS